MSENFAVPYPYRPLQSDRHFRLLLLKPPASSTTQGSPLISATLHEFKLEPKYVSIAGKEWMIPHVTHVPCPWYKALSYEWGLPPSNPSDNPMMLLDNHTIHIRQNLHDALNSIIRNHHHIYGESPLYLWVDALCINQLDDKEKGHQVRLMRDIYKEADQVIIWLGMGTVYTERAIEVINMDEKALRRYARDGNLTEKEWEGIVDIYCKPTYWRRVWILQEVVLARDFVVLCNGACVSKRKFECGLRVFEWEGLILTTKRQRSDQSSAVNESIRKFADELYSKSTVEWIISLDSVHLSQSVTLDRWLDMLYAHDFKATDPRDYVFAVLGISVDGHQITPDYGLSPSGVYFKAISTPEARKRLSSDELDWIGWADLMGIPKSNVISMLQQAEMEIEEDDTSGSED